MVYIYIYTYIYNDLIILVGCTSTCIYCHVNTDIDNFVVNPIKEHPHSTDGLLEQWASNRTK